MHLCYHLMRIFSLFALHFNLYKIPQFFDLIHADDEVTISVLDSPVLNVRQFNQTVSVQRLFDRICSAPPGQKAGEQGIHLFHLARFRHQRENPFRTLNMCRCRLLIELDFQVPAISHAHKHRLT